VDSEFIKSFSLETFITALRKHWFPAAIVFGATALAAVLAMIFLPRTYGSGAMIFVKLGRETVSLDPTATTGSTISVLDTRDNEINSIRDMLYSRGIAEQVVDRIGPEVVLGDAPLTDEVKKPTKSQIKDYRNSPRQKAIRQLIEDTFVVSSRKSSVLTLNSEGSSPELAQRIVQEYLDVYQSMHTDAHQTPESNSFFKEQSRLLRGRWKESMKALQIAKEDAGVVSIEGARENLKEQTNAIQSALMSVTSRYVSTEAKLEKFKFLVSKNPLDRARVTQERLNAQGDLSAMAAQKEALTSQLDELLDRAAKLNRDEVMIGQLQKAVDLSANNYAQYQELYEQSRIEEALHSSQFTNVRVVQPPSFVPKPISPNRKLIAAAGLVAATTGAILTVFFFELFWDPSRLETKDDNSDLETEILKNNEFLTGSPITNG
jgi:uncharacterized protein involved in exopolysaccharide biosynthesis